MPLHLNKRLGQHFLVDPSVCQRMVAALRPLATDCLLEIGPGAGALTRELLRAPHACLLLLEKDPRWASIHRPTQTSHCILQDALTFAFERLPPNWTLVGNLPYNVASPLLWTMAATTKAPKQALFMVQKEVAERIVATPGSRAYGALSVWIQSFWQPRRLFTVKPAAFTPRPKVNSSVFIARPLPSPLAPDLLLPTQRLLNLVFQKRRKQLGTILREAHLPDWPEALHAAAVPKIARPEECSTATFHTLARFFSSVLTNPPKVR